MDNNHGFLLLSGSEASLRVGKLGGLYVRLREAGQRCTVEEQLKALGFAINVVSK